MPDLDFVPMVPTDNVLVALAMELSYTISIDVRSLLLGGNRPRYRGDLPKGVNYYHDDLLRLLTTMIQNDRASLQLQQSIQQDQPEQPEREPLGNQVEDQKREIQQLEWTIRDLKQQLNLEHRYLMDTQARGFIGFLKRHPQTPFTQKLLATHEFTIRNQASCWTYKGLLQKMDCTNDELEEFKKLWMLLLLETPHPDA